MNDVLEVVVAVLWYGFLAVFAVGFLAYSSVIVRLVVDAVRAIARGLWHSPLVEGAQRLARRGR